jgi:hypothetical protein
MSQVFLIGFTPGTTAGNDTAVIRFSIVKQGMNEFSSSAYRADRLFRVLFSV